MYLRCIKTTEHYWFTTYHLDKLYQSEYKSPKTTYKKQLLRLSFMGKSRPQRPVNNAGREVATF